MALWVDAHSPKRIHNRFSLCPVLIVHKTSLIIFFSLRVDEDRRVMISNNILFGSSQNLSKLKENFGHMGVGVPLPKETLISVIRTLGHMTKKGLFSTFTYKTLLLFARCTCFSIVLVSPWIHITKSQSAFSIIASGPGFDIILLYLLLMLTALTGIVCRR